jgi:hypothetical protein
LVTSKLRNLSLMGSHDIIPCFRFDGSSIAKNTIESNKNKNFDNKKPPEGGLVILTVLFQCQFLVAWNLSHSALMTS